MHNDDPVALVGGVRTAIGRFGGALKDVEAADLGAACIREVIARVEADVEGEDVKLRLQGVEILDKKAAAIISGLTIFVRDSKPLDSIAQRLVNGGRSPVRLVFLMDQGREVELALGNKFTVTPQIKGAIKAIAGVVDVQDL